MHWNSLGWLCGVMHFWDRPGIPVPFSIHQTRVGEIQLEFLPFYQRRTIELICWSKTFLLIYSRIQLFIKELIDRHQTFDFYANFKRCCPSSSIRRLLNIYLKNNKSESNAIVSSTPTSTGRKRSRSTDETQKVLDICSQTEEADSFRPSKRRKQRLGHELRHASIHHQTEKPNEIDIASPEKVPTTFHLTIPDKNVSSFLISTFRQEDADIETFDLFYCASPGISFLESWSEVVVISLGSKEQWFSSFFSTDQRLLVVIIYYINYQYMI